MPQYGAYTVGINRVFWDNEGQISKFLTTKKLLNTTKITPLQKILIFKVLNFYKIPLKFLIYKKQ